MITGNFSGSITFSVFNVAFIACWRNFLSQDSIHSVTGLKSADSLTCCAKDGPSLAIFVTTQKDAGIRGIFDLSKKDLIKSRIPISSKL